MPLIRQLIPGTYAPGPGKICTLGQFLKYNSVTVGHDMDMPLDLCAVRIGKSPPVSKPGRHLIQPGSESFEVLGIPKGLEAKINYYSGLWAFSVRYTPQYTGFLRSGNSESRPSFSSSEEALEGLKDWLRRHVVSTD